MGRSGLLLCAVYIHCPTTTHNQNAVKTSDSTVSSIYLMFHFYLDNEDGYFESSHIHYWVIKYYFTKFEVAGMV
jgi:hypothetical protein